jgi:FkbM family methyltransferase
MAYFQETDYALALDCLRVLPNRSVLDVGAELGSFVDAALTADCGPVFAFEPYPPNVDALHSRFGDRDDVRVFDLAIGAADGDELLHLANNAAGEPFTYYHSLLTLPDTQEIHWAGTLPVRCRSLASLVEEQAIPRDVGLLKIDTEGGDLAVLMGMGDLNPTLILVECWDSMEATTGGSPYTLQDLVDVLAPRGFGDFAFVKRHDEFEVIETNDVHTRAGDWGNVLFVHRDLAKLVVPVINAAVVKTEERLIDRALLFKRASDERLRLIEELQTEADRRLAIISHLTDPLGLGGQHLDAVPNFSLRTWLRVGLRGVRSRLRPRRSP